ncbi:hypothetical protein ANO11243_091440 [Dothideomycetidae sp. 11243]|nr:hypothetical protein ANO11243_091440 [fungal sp. No.11243]
MSRLVPSEMSEFWQAVSRSEENQTLKRYHIGPNTPEQCQINADMSRKSMIEDPHEYWLKVKDESSGQIIAGSMWKIHPTVVPQVLDFEYPCTWFDDDAEKKRLVQEAWDQAILVRRRLFTQPHIELVLIFTEPRYERRGAASMMIQWGCDLADRMFLPVYVQSLRNRNSLYEKFGFEIRDDIEPVWYIMTREARVDPVEGGKEAVAVSSVEV